MSCWGPKDALPDAKWYAYTDVSLPNRPPSNSGVERGGLQIWLNGQPLYRRLEAKPYLIDSDRFSGNLPRESTAFLCKPIPPVDGSSFTCASAARAQRPSMNG